MGSLLKDVQFGLRMALKHPGMSIIVILTFGLGIGLTTTVFSIVNGIFGREGPAGIGRIRIASSGGSDTGCRQSHLS